MIDLITELIQTIIVIPNHANGVIISVHLAKKHLHTCFGDIIIIIVSHKRLIIHAIMITYVCNILLYDYIVADKISKYVI